MAGTKTRNFIYKTAVFLQETGDAKVTLESLLKKAVAKTPMALDRVENPDGAEFRFLNYANPHLSSSHTVMLYGCEFLAFEKGADQSTIKLDPTAKEVDLNAITARSGEEFLAGAVYFGVVGNHVVLVQSRSLRAIELEKYLNWFLVQRTAVLPEDNRVALTDHIPVKKRSMFQGVRGIEITAPVHLQPVAATSGSTSLPGGEQRSMSVKLAGKAWNAVKALIGDGFDLPDHLTVADIAHAPEVEVSLYLRWKAERGEEDLEFLNSVARNMSHVDEEFGYDIHTRAGTITKGDFKIFQSHTFKWGDGRPLFDDIFPKMSAWLAALIKSGRVET